MGGEFEKVLHNIIKYCLPEKERERERRETQEVGRLDDWANNAGLNSVRLDHDKGFFAAKQERILIDHGLHNVFEVGTQLFEMAHVGELDRN